MIRNISFTILIVIQLSVCLISLCSCGGKECSGTSLTETVDLQGHRGARGNRPENTLPAFQFCMESGMTTIELDTNVTKDKQLIIYHDSELNGEICADAQGNPAKKTPIGELTVAELKSYDCGVFKNEKFPDQQPVKDTRLATLPELFQFVKKWEKEKGITIPFQFNAEIKLPDNASIEEILEAARIMVKTIEDAGMVDRVTVQSFVMEALVEVRRLNKSIKTSALFQPTYPQGFLLTIGCDANSDDIIQKTVEIGANIISPYYLYVTSDFIKKCHEKNIQVVPWTVNEPEIMERLMNCGVDGIISDYPVMLKKIHDAWRKGAGK